MKIEKIYIQFGWYNPFTDKVEICTTADFYDKQKALEWIEKEKEDSKNFRVIRCFKAVTEWFVADDENLEWAEVEDVPEGVL